MLTDAHCHPFDLKQVFPVAEEERRRLNLMCAASASDGEECAYNEDLARQAAADGAAPMLPCFAIHPQLPAADKDKPRTAEPGNSVLRGGLETLEILAGQRKLAAVGETGFDLFNTAYRETEKIQEELFAAHLEIALRYELPLVLHVRRAMHKIFAHAKTLQKCRAVIFHSWPGTAGEGEALLKRGVNAFFSFGTTILLNHREAMRCCAVFPAARLLTETDAPYQPLRGKAYSRWEDIPLILEAAAALRREASPESAGAQKAGGEGINAGELETIITSNFRAAFGLL
jgi:TatD DNase family protein